MAEIKDEEGNPVEGVRSEHCVIQGDSDSGKTTLLRQYQAEATNHGGASIVVNHTGADGFAGYQAGSMEGLESAVDHFDKPEALKVDLRSKVKEPIELYSLGVRFCYRFSKTFPQTPIQVLCDEVTPILNWSPKGEEPGKANNPAAWVLREGRDKGIKGIFADQVVPTTKPVKDHLAQARWWIWVGPPAGLHQSWFNAHKWVPQDELPTERFEYVTMDKSGEVRFRGKTEKRFA